MTATKDIFRVIRQIPPNSPEITIWYGFTDSGIN